MGEKQAVSALCAKPIDNAIGTCAHRVKCFTAGASVIEKTPAGALDLDIGGTSTLVVTVVPFHQIVVLLDASVRHRQFGSAPCALQRTGEDAIETECGKARLELARLLLSSLGQWKIGATGVLSRQRPCRLAVTHEEDPWKARVHVHAPAQ